MDMRKIVRNNVRQLLYHGIALAGLVCSLISGIIGSKVFFLISIPLIIVGGTGLFIKSNISQRRRMLIFGVAGTIVVIILIWILRSVN
jgi:FtsH-binding integral membrane protein